MNEERKREEKLRRNNRILALIFSGTLVMIFLPLTGVIISFIIDSLFGLPDIIPYPINMLVGVILLGIGFFWAIWSNFELYKSGKGSPVPLKGTETIELVNTGPYKYSRNPMIFGYILFWLGLGFIFNSMVLIFGFTLIVSALLIIMVKFWEEKNLKKRFGNSYLEYKKKVSFLIPLPPKK